jgi:acyl carrier protein
VRGSNHTAGTPDSRSDDEQHHARRDPSGIAELVHQVVGVPVEQVTPDASLADDLGVDSLSLLEIAVGIEEKFGLRVPGRPGCRTAPRVGCGRVHPGRAGLIGSARLAAAGSGILRCMTTYETLSYDVADGILTLLLNRPDALNSFTLTMADELEHAFRRASDDDDVAAIVVTGAGRAFCAGMDLTREGNVFGLDESQDPTNEDMRDRLDDPSIAVGVRDTGGRVTLAIYDCKKPVIAAVNGAAVGIGATMICAMDVRLASEKARIGFVFGKIGITPEACSSWFLPRIVGVSRALEMLYSAEIMTARGAGDRTRAVGARTRRPAPRGVRAGAEVHRATAPPWPPRSRGS